MAYEGMRDGARRVLMCLEPGKAQTVTAVRQTVFLAYQEDDPRTVFHLEKLAYIGLAEKVALTNQQIGYSLSELGIRASNEVSIRRKSLN